MSFNVLRKLIKFSSFLEEDYNGAVYFANSFFEIKEQKNLQLRVSRTEPIKIWIDGKLVFENWRKVNFEWDMETDEGEVFTIYDWKEYRVLRSDEMITWHIGSKSKSDSNVAERELLKAL